MISKILMAAMVSLWLTSCGPKPAIIQMQETSEAPSVEPSENRAEQTETPPEKVTSPAQIFVHVCGAVNKPGVYEMNEDNRIFEAIELAGGFTDEANQPSVNLADKVVDGQQVFVPNQEEAAQMPNRETMAGGVEQNLVNINTADVMGLQLLTGIGEAKAKEILRYREKNGLFNSIEDIKNVSGIGEKLYEKIKENITVD